MATNDLKMITAVLLAGIVSGEGTTNDDRALKRAALLAEKLNDLLDERALAKPVTTPQP